MRLSKMDQIFGKVSFRFKHSIEDSIMMSILHSAMDRAQVKMQSKEGDIVRLNEISMFYQMALMQLDGCLKFVQEEADSGLESSDEEVLGDLAEIRERLEGRLKESELAMEEKDRELIERLENEVKLRQALDNKQRELESLRANLDLERRKSEGLGELLVLGNLASADEGRDEEISELKNSVDQQVWNIKQKLDLDNDLLDKRKNHCFDGTMVEEMRSDIEMLKETMDIAFGRMQSAILLSELEPVEEQLEWTIWKDLLAISIKGFMRDIQEHLNVEFRKREKEVSIGLSKQLSGLLEEVTCLHDELEPLGTFRTKVEGNSCLKARRTSSEGDRYNILDAAFGVGQMMQTKQEDPENDDGHLVATMIKNHETIIRRKSEEMNWLKREIIRDKRSLPPKREKEPVSPRRMIQNVIIRLENLISWNAKLGETFHEYGGDEDDEMSSANKFWSYIKTEQEKSEFGTFEDAWEKANSLSISHEVIEGLYNEMWMLKKEKEDKELQNMVMERTYLTLLEGFVNEFHTNLCGYGLEILIREETQDGILREIFNKWTKKLERDKIMDRIREEVFSVLISWTMKELGSNFECATLEIQDWRARCSYLEDVDLEGKINESTLKILFKETCLQWNDVIERHEPESISKEETCQSKEEMTISNGTINSAHAPGGRKTEVVLEKSNYSQSDDSVLCAEYSIKEDLHMTFLREMSKEWKKEIDTCSLESFVRERISLLVIIEVVKQAGSISAEAKIAHDPLRIPQHFTYAKKLHKGLEISAAETSTQKQDSRLKCTKVGEDLTRSKGSYLQDYGAYLDLRGSEHDMNKLERSKGLFGEMRSASILVTSEVNEALEQLIECKTLLSELRSNLGKSVEDTKKPEDKVESIEPCPYRMVSHLLQPEEATLVLKMTTFDPSAFSSIVEFTQVFMDFKSKAEEKLELQILRLEEATHDFNSLHGLVGSRKKKESLYKRAFISRCQSLRKAEIEVDLLGDQVDVLQGILEQIYNMLYQSAPILQQCIEVSNILEMINKELTGSVPVSSKSRVR